MTETKALKVGEILGFSTLGLEVPDKNCLVKFGQQNLRSILDYAALSIEGWSDQKARYGTHAVVMSNTNWLDPSEGGRRHIFDPETFRHCATLPSKNAKIDGVWSDCAHFDSYSRTCCILSALGDKRTFEPSSQCVIAALKPAERNAMKEKLQAEFEHSQARLEQVWQLKEDLNSLLLQAEPKPYLPQLRPRKYPETGSQACFFPTDCSYGIEGVVSENSGGFINFIPNGRGISRFIGHYNNPRILTPDDVCDLLIDPAYFELWRQYSSPPVSESQIHAMIAYAT